MAALLVNRKGEVGIIIQGVMSHTSFIIIKAMGSTFKAQTIIREDETHAKLGDTQTGSYDDDRFIGLIPLEKYKRDNLPGWQAFEHEYPEIAEQMEKASAEAPQ